MAMAYANYDQTLLKEMLDSAMIGLQQPGSAAQAPAVAAAPAPAPAPASPAAAPAPAAAAAAPAAAHPATTTIATTSQDHDDDNKKKQQPYASLDDFAERVDFFIGYASRVSLATCRATAEDVVLKAFLKSQMRPRVAKLVAREVALMRAIEYPGSVRCLGDFEDDEAVHLVLEYCERGDLVELLEDGGGALGEAYVAGQIIAPLLLTLRHLHARGVVHRDIKADNVFVTAEGRVRLGDYGVSIDARRERPQSAVGTKRYMAPEIARAKASGGAYGDRVDIFSLGALAYELLAGRRREPTPLCELFAADAAFARRATPQARSFIRAALADDEAARPSAAELLRHAWIRPHLVVALGGAAPDGTVAWLAAADTTGETLAALREACGLPPTAAVEKEPMAPKKQQPADSAPVSSRTRSKTRATATATTSGATAAAATTSNATSSATSDSAPVSSRTRSKTRAATPTATATSGGAASIETTSTAAAAAAAVPAAERARRARRVVTDDSAAGAA